MIGLIQRVSEASVTVENSVIGQIGPGLLALIGVAKSDNEKSVRLLIDKILGYRVFSDANGRMNLSLTQSAGGLLLVPQFTLVADTRQGSRPGFSTGAPPAAAKELFELLVEQVSLRHADVSCGQFGADMQVALINDGPVTFWLETPPGVV